MATIGYLSINVWAKGWLTEPKLVLLFDPPTASALTLQYALYDPNGVQVTDLATSSIPAGTSEFTVNLGDYLDAQQTAKGFGAGLYFIIARIAESGEVFALPLIATISTLYFTPPEPEYLTSYSIMDTITGAFMYLPKTLTVIPTDPRFRVFLHYHKENKGRIIGIDEFGNIMFDTGYHQLAYLTITLKFRSTHDMLFHMLSHSYGLTKRVALEALKAVQAGEIEEALMLLRPFYTFTFAGRILTAEFDVEKYEIRLKTVTYLGQFDWFNIFKWGAGGCGVAVAVALAVTALTAGAGAITAPLIAGACIAGAGIGIFLMPVTSASSDKPETVPRFVYDIEKRGEEAKRQNEEHYNKAKEILNKWLSEGKITKEDYDEMMKVLDSWKVTMDSAIDDLVTLGVTGVKQSYKEGYDDGYKKAVEERRWWIVGAGAGGLLLGIILGRR